MDARLENPLSFGAEEEGKPRRRRLWIALAAAVLVAGAGVAFVMLRPSGGKPGASAASTTAGASAATAKDEKNGDKEKEKAPVPVSVAPVESGPVSSYITATANLVAEEEVRVLAEAEGRLAQLHVEEGDRVGRGEVLATLVRDDAAIARSKAQLRVTNSRLAFERGESMKRESLISQESFDKLKMDYEIARQELAEADWRLGKTTIRSPFTGRVTLRNVQLGQHIRPGDHLFTVADFEPLVARIYLPEKDILGLAEGREVRLTLKADESTRFAGRIRQISPVVDPATGTVKVTVEAVEPPAAVRPGGFVTVDVVRETHPRALLVPRQAVLRELQRAHVFVAKGELAEKREVTLGMEEGEQVEAVSGVAAGEQVIVAGQGSLKDGSKIKLLQTEAAPPPPQTAKVERPGR